MANIRKSGNANCSVYGCHSKYGREKLSFHRFPRKNERLVSITNKLGVIEKIDRKLAWERVLLRATPASVALRICSRHFRREDYLLPDVKSMRPRLRFDAVPSCNLPKRPSDNMRQATSTRRDVEVPLQVWVKDEVPVDACEEAADDVNPGCSRTTGCTFDNFDKNTLKMNSDVNDEPKHRRGNKTHLRLSTKRKSRKTMYKTSSLVNINKPEDSQFIDDSNDIEEHIHQFKVGLNQKSAVNNNVITPSTSNCGNEVVRRKPWVKIPYFIQQPVIKPLISTSLKREKNLRTYSRRPKNSEVIDTVSATSEVTLSNKESTASHWTSIVADPLDFEDCAQDEIVQFTKMEVKMENDESDDPISPDTIIDNIKYEVVSEEYNEHHNLRSTDNNFIKDVPSLQHEITKNAEEIIKRTRCKKYDLNTLNFIREQLHQVLEVLKSAEQTSANLIS